MTSRDRRAREFFEFVLELEITAYLLGRKKSAPRVSLGTVLDDYQHDVLPRLLPGYPVSPDDIANSFFVVSAKFRGNKNTGEYKWK